MMQEKDKKRDFIKVGLGIIFMPNPTFLYHF